MSGLLRFTGSMQMKIATADAAEYVTRVLSHELDAGIISPEQFDAKMQMVIANLL